MDIWGILEYTAAVTVIGLLIWLVKAMRRRQRSFGVGTVLEERRQDRSLYKDIRRRNFAGGGECVERNTLRCLKWGIVFDFLDFSIGRFEVLPDFVGMLLFYAAIQGHDSRTQGEEQVKPLFLLLAADYFVHWIWQFENGVEMLLTTVIYIYAIYVLFGEVAERIRVQQPERARQLDVIRRGMVLLQVFAFVSSAFGNNVLNIAMIFALVALAASCTVVICGIVPEEDGG